MHISKSLEFLLFDQEIERTAKRIRKARLEKLQRIAENSENANPSLVVVPIRVHFKLMINALYFGIVHGTINAKNFEINPALINMVRQNQFGDQPLQIHVFT